MSTTNAIATIATIKASDITRHDAKTGKLVVMGKRYEFGSGTFADWRSRLKAGGMTNSEANKFIRQALEEGEGEFRWVEAQVILEAARSRGMLPTKGELRDKTGCIRFAKAPEVKLTKKEVAAQATAAKEAEIADLRKQIETLKAQLAK